MPERDNLMRVQMKAVVGIVMTQEQFFEADRFSKLIHTTLRTINLNAGECLLHNRRALIADEASHSTAAALIIRDTPTRAEVLQVGVELRTDSQGRSPDRALDGAALLDRENATAIDMTLRSVLSCLQVDYVIRLFLTIIATKQSHFLWYGHWYEMLWNCGACGSEKLLGVTHRHCPNCGAAQEASRRYFPSDEEKVAVADHRYTGVDHQCAGACRCCREHLGALRFHARMDEGLQTRTLDRVLEHDGAHGDAVDLALLVQDARSPPRLQFGFQFGRSVQVAHQAVRVAHHAPKRAQDAPHLGFAAADAPDQADHGKFLWPFHAPPSLVVVQVKSPLFCDQGVRVGLHRCRL